MYMESQIAEAVMLRMIKAGAIALPIHDSFVVRRSYQWELERIMEEEFLRITGSPIPLKWDETEFETEAKTRPQELIDVFDFSKSAEEYTAKEQKRQTYNVYTTLLEDWLNTHTTKPPHSTLEH